MSNMNGGAAAYEFLKVNGIKTVFGLLGGSMLELYDAMYIDGAVSYVGARDERAAGHMADAYARISGGPGVVLGAQAGPGVANLVTAVTEAYLAYSPLVVIAGAISRPDLGKDTFQEIDQVALFQPVCKRSLLVTDVTRLVPTLEDAFRLAMSGRRGPVVVHVPRDIMSAQVPKPSLQPVQYSNAGQAGQQVVQQMLDLVKDAIKPVIVAGAGFKWGDSSAQLVRLAEKLQIPVVASTGHADIMPHDHPLFAGQGGPRGNAVASRLTREADRLLVLGARLAFNSTFHSNDYISATAKIIHVDIEGSAIGRYFPVEIGVQADAGQTAAALSAAISPDLNTDAWKEWRDTFTDDRLKLLEQRDAEANEKSKSGSLMHPRRALGEIRQTLPDNALVTLDTGNACLQAADRLNHRQCPSLVTPLDFGLVGFGYAAAIGVQAASPERPVVSIMGDGGFGFTMSEITTAVNYRLPVIAIVLDNAAWGAEKAYQMEFFAGRLIGAEIDSPRYDRVAELCGARGWYVEEAGQLEVALKEALASGEPSVIHVRIDPDSLSTLRKDLFK